MQVIDPNGCYTAEEAAEVLSVSRSTLQRYFHQGLKVRRPRGKIHILGCDMLDFLKKEPQENNDSGMHPRLENRIAKAVLDIRKGKHQSQQAAGR